MSGVIEEVEAAATKFVQEQLAKFEEEIRGTTGATRDAYRKVQEQTTTPEPITVEFRTNEKGDYKEWPEVKIYRTFNGHIYC